MSAERWRRYVGSTEVIKLSVGEMDNNVYILGNETECLLIDGSFEADAILAAVGDRSLTRIIQTHDHFDHVQALPDLVQKTGAPVYAHPADTGSIPMETHPLAEGVTIDAAGVKLSVLHTPGHTPGGLCFVLEEDGQTLVFAGDTLFPGGPGGTFGDAKAFQQIMESIESKLMVLPDDAEILPGHGDDTTIGDERPNLGEWRARGW